MGDVRGKKIILAISGSIAAYKSVFLLRLLQKAGAEVRVIMTRHATDFITPLTFEAITHYPVHIDSSSHQSWNNHIELALWADLMIVAPATANVIAKMATGQVDDMVTACHLAARCKIAVAPSMDVDMWHHPATQHNIKTLLSRGVLIIPVGNGYLASGLEGEGRMAEPLDILEFVLHTVSDKKTPLSGKKILITAGPTYEALDPVRFIGNSSTGKMGIALAEVIANLGAKVSLILGPTTLRPAHPGIELVHVMTADQMLEAALKIHPTTDICIFAAAVADYRPKKMSVEKIKKSSDTLDLQLIKNPDIAYTLGQRKKNKQLHIGFALESTQGEQYAKEKLKKKNFDLVVLNSLKDTGAGFAVDTNKTTFFFKNNKSKKFELKSKSEVAQDITQAIITLLKDKK